MIHPQMRGECGLSILETMQTLPLWAPPAPCDNMKCCCACIKSSYTVLASTDCCSSRVESCLLHSCQLHLLLGGANQRTDNLDVQYSLALGLAHSVQPIGKKGDFTINLICVPVCLCAAQAEEGCGSACTSATPTGPALSAWRPLECPPPPSSWPQQAEHRLDPCSHRAEPLRDCRCLRLLCLSGKLFNIMLDRCPH